MTTTTQTITRQKVAAILKDAGVEASHQGRNQRIGYATTSYGFSAIENGTTVYICKHCGGKDSHNTGCKATGAAKNWRQSKVSDGTVTVELHSATSAREYEAAKIAADSERVTAALEAAGFTVSQIKQTLWHVAA